MDVFIEKEQKTVSGDWRGSAKALLETLNIPTETVLIVKDGVLITPEDSVDGALRIELLSVVSGG